MARVVRKFIDPANDLEDSFSGSNNQSTPANVTGFAFANANVRSFKAFVDVQVDATANLYEVVEILGIQKDSDWEISLASAGDDSQVEFSITSTGQIQYTSGNYSGFNSLTINFRAFTNDI